MMLCGARRAAAAAATHQRLALGTSAAPRRLAPTAQAGGKKRRKRGGAFGELARQKKAEKAGGGGVGGDEGTAAAAAAPRAATAVKSAPKGSKGAFGDLMAMGRRAIDPSAPGAALPDGRIPLSVHTVTPTLPVPANIPRPSYADTGKPPAWNDSYQLAKTQAHKDRMRAAGALAAKVRDAAGAMVKPGVTTDEIDRFVHQMIIDAGAYPSPLNYGNFPKSVCTSVNECICHGIPDMRPLVDGDIVNIDVTVYLDGVHGDTSFTFYCGDVSDEARDLVRTTRRALEEAIHTIKPGSKLSEIGRRIQQVADEKKYGVVENYVGHGVGETFHSGPTVFHMANSQPGVIEKDMTFTVEPMLTLTGRIAERTWPDKWTVVTADAGITAQFEHTLLVTDDGVEILTPYTWEC